MLEGILIGLYCATMIPMTLWIVPKLPEFIEMPDRLSEIGPERCNITTPLQMSTESLLGELPDEVLTHIFDFLSPKEKYRASQACNHLWQLFDQGAIYVSHIKYPQKIPRLLKKALEKQNQNNYTMPVENEPNAMVLAPDTPDVSQLWKVERQNTESALVYYQITMHDHQNNRKDLRLVTPELTPPKNPHAGLLEEGGLIWNEGKVVYIYIPTDKGNSLLQFSTVPIEEQYKGASIPLLLCEEKEFTLKEKDVKGRFRLKFSSSY